MHGSDWDSLKDYIPASILPSEWGGEAGPYDNSSWKEEFLSIDQEFSPIGDEGISKKKKKKRLGLKRATKGTVKRIAKLTGKKSSTPRKVYEADKAKEEEKTRKSSKSST